MTVDDSPLRIDELYVADDDLMRALRIDAGIDPDDFEDGADE